MAEELGYQYLDTRFTGTQSIPLSSCNEEIQDFLLPIDLGVAHSLEQIEGKSYFI